MEKASVFPHRFVLQACASRQMLEAPAEQRYLRLPCVSGCRPGFIDAFPLSDPPRQPPHPALPQADVTSGFFVSFDVQFGPTSSSPADGVAFVLYEQAATAVPPSWACSNIGGGLW